jgi:16S rRNA (guanine966-N2)-methyltransferase
VVRCGAVASVLAAAAGRPVDVVFADPPYDVPPADVEAVLALLADRGWVSPGTLVVVERPASGPGLVWPSGWMPLRDRRYGDTRLEFAEVA